MKTQHFFALLSRMKHINRWGLMRNTQQENIAEHSLMVAMLAHALAVIRNTYFNGNIDEGRVCALAVYHDASEIITGDLPTPVKYFNPQISEAYKQVEKVACDKLLSLLPQEMQKEYQSLIEPRAQEGELWELVKAADKLSAYIKCIEERKAGNTEFRQAERTILSSLKAMKIPEVEFFLDRFIESFGLTLDELD